MSMNEFRGSNGQTLTTMQNAMEAAMQHQSTTTTAAPAPVRFVNPKSATARAQESAQASITPQGNESVLPDVGKDSVLWLRHQYDWNMVPRTGHDGQIIPTIGWLIDVLGLEYIEQKTKHGTHLVILRNAHPLRKDTEVNSLYHFYFPAESVGCLMISDTAEGTFEEILADIKTRQDDFAFEPMSNEFDAAFAVSNEMALAAYHMATVHPVMKQRMDYWHARDYLPGMNYL